MPGVSGKACWSSEFEKAANQRSVRASLSLRVRGSILNEESTGMGDSGVLDEGVSWRMGLAIDI